MSKFEVPAAKGDTDIDRGGIDHDGRARAADGPAYAFRPAERQDLPLLQRWLWTPEVVRWWGDAQEQAALLREDLD